MDLVAVAKVVPTGYAVQGKTLRATVMFTPATDTLDQSQLAIWPTAMLAHLRNLKGEWTLPLTFKLKGTDETFSLNARARAAQETWGNTEQHAKWVESLWQSCFKVETGHWTGLAVVRGQANLKPRNIEQVNPETVWESLLESITESNRGRAVKSDGAPARQSDRSPEPGLARAAFMLVADDQSNQKECTQGAMGTTVVNPVAAVRQTDLAVLLESQRALELMSTLHATHADPADKETWSKLESTCVQLAQKGEVPGSVDQKVKNAANSLQQHTRRHASYRYRKAAFEISRAYEQHCPGFVCPIKVVDAKPAPKRPPVRVDELFANSDHHDAIYVRRTQIVNELSRVMAGMKGTDDSRLAFDHNDKDRTDTKDLKNIVSQRFFTIQGSPSLSRLFGLTVDVEFTYDELKDAAKRDLKTATLPEVGFMWVSTQNPGIVDKQHIADADKSASHRRVWTLTGFDKTTRFWPATLLEAEGDQKQPSPQLDGVLVAAAPQDPPDAQKNANGGRPFNLSRFVITSLNVQNAVEGAIDLGYQSVAQSTPGSAGAHGLRKTHQTAGLVLLDRGRRDFTQGQLDRRDMHLCEQATHTGELYLDAQDLVVGYRIDVAVPAQPDMKRPKDGKAQADTANAASPSSLPWRTLMARRIEHGASGLFPELVKQAMSALLAPPQPGDRGHIARAAGRIAASDEWSQTIEDAVLGLPIRIVPTDEANRVASSEQHADAYVEEAVALWSGDPMGAHCAGPSEHKTVAADLATGDTICLPDDHNDPQRRPPPLRFGRAYRFGIRAVYVGGISVPLSYAAKIYDTASNVTIPGHGIGEDRGFRRFLRHERVDAPFLLLHEDVAIKPYGAMGYERASHAIIRSAEGAQAFRGFPGKTQRVFAPPSVEPHFVNLHGSFDQIHSTKLPQGLRGVNFNHEKGGFPVADVENCSGINGEVYGNPPLISTKEGAVGDLVYARSSRDVNKRKKPYYPDPFAKYYVVGIRYAGTHQYLDGGPFTIPVFPGTHYPDAKPFVLNIERRASASGNVIQTLSDVLSVPAHGNKAADKTPEATLYLRPGDDFEVDVWCIPDWQDLANCSALVEAIGAIALQSVQMKDGQKATHADVCKALAALLPKDASVRILNCSKQDSSTASSLGWRDGFGGLWAPRKLILQTIAEIVRSTLSTRPLSEMAAVRTLRCTHAIDKPSRKPMLVTPTREGKKGRAVRAERRSIEVPPPQQPGSSANGQQQPPLPLPGTYAQAMLEYRLTGDVEVDLLSTGGLDIVANATLPTTQAFDDPQRGRSVKDKREDNWPAVDGKKLSPSRVFGFEVDADGNVTLPQGFVTLLGIDDISMLAVAKEKPGDTSPTRVALENYTLTPLESKTSALPDGQGVVKTRHVFPDKRARKLELYVIGKPRHAAFMRTANSSCKDDFLKPGVNLPLPQLDENDMPLVAFLNSGVRPSAPLCRTPIPVFYWEPGQETRLFGVHKELSRRSSIRISMSRGWFSSGVDEQLGIVVWPAVRDPENEDMLESDRVPAPSDPNRVMDLSDFEDIDLGAGGQFITRWGDDPVRPPHLSSDITKSHTFIPQAAFGDLDRSKLHGFRADLIKTARMPIRKNNTVENSASASAAPESFLDVALVAYTPRFDVRTEEWYVDVDIEHPTEAEPFVRLGLVRYQQHAEPELQVSYPIIQWTQLLPRRRVEVDYVSKPDFKEVFVSIVGQQAAASFGLPVPTTGPKEPESEHRMHVKVVRQYRNAHAVKCMEIKCEEVALRDFFPDALEAGGEVRWTSGPHLIEFNPKADKEESATYHVYIEERDYYLPATYASEPVSPDQARGKDVDRIASGPRFAAHVDLS
ncbi:hypothetical protein [Cupriavidus lacunae]|uniref:Uncharacterized protein n=1 Tax=Cupriavidus lacunae TaxID=2666307 RepID=A0A370NIE4_9BURK|nr:hypothetical protein [Cupriavidus lacunae]RDK05370.1 hypothetical protein DN412_37395 [Cupriavidus lacunae]